MKGKFTFILENNQKLINKERKFIVFILDHPSIAQNLLEVYLNTFFLKD
jgi:hypothetical protein